MIDETMNAEETKSEKGSSATAFIREDLSAEKREQIYGDELLMTVLASPELLVNIILFVIDPKLPTALCSLSTVYKSFCEAMTSNSFWEDMVHGKWGSQWDAALNEHFFSGEQLQAGFWKSFYVEAKNREDAEARMRDTEARMMQSLLETLRDPNFISQAREILDALNLNEIFDAAGDY